MIQGLDVLIYNLSNGLAGNWVLDRLVNEEQSVRLLNGGIFLALYWYLWFRGGPGQDRRRGAIVAIAIGTLSALAVSRTLAFLLPFRIRPMYNLSLTHHVFSIPITPNMENWSAFPSDTATYFFALGLGVAYLSRRLAIPIMSFTAIWICFPRMYLGLHYASDIVVGAAIGVTVVWIALNAHWTRFRLVPRILAFMDSQPGLFYAAAFLLSFEMASMFDDVRHLLHVVPVLAQHHVLHYALIPAATGCVVLAAAGLTLLYRRRQHPSAGAITPQDTLLASKRSA